MLSEMGPYGSIWAHIKTGRSHMPQDHFQTPFDPQKVYNNPKIEPNRETIKFPSGEPCVLSWPLSLPGVKRITQWLFMAAQPLICVVRLQKLPMHARCSTDIPSTTDSSKGPKPGKATIKGNTQKNNVVCIFPVHGTHV